MPECPKFEKNSFIFIMLIENVWGRAWIQRTRKLLEMLIFYYVYVHVWFCLFQQNSYVIHTNTLTITIKIGHTIAVCTTNTHTPMQAILLIHQLHCIHIEYSSKPNEQMYIIIFHIQGWFHVDQLFSFSTSNFNSRLCYNSKLNSNLFHTKHKLPSFSTWDNGTMKIYWNLQLNSTKVLNQLVSTYRLEFINSLTTNYRRIFCWNTKWKKVRLGFHMTTYIWHFLDLFALEICVAIRTLSMNSIY